jgi:hypothetical protein
MLIHNPPVVAHRFLLSSYLGPRPFSRQVGQASSTRNTEKKRERERERMYVTSYAERRGSVESELGESLQKFFDFNKVFLLYVTLFHGKSIVSVYQKRFSFSDSLSSSDLFHGYNGKLSGSPSSPVHFHLYLFKVILVTACVK